MGNICSNSFYTYWKETQWVRNRKKYYCRNQWLIFDIHNQAYTSRRYAWVMFPSQSSSVDSGKIWFFKTILKIPVEKTVETKVSKISLKSAI